MVFLHCSRFFVVVTNAIYRTSWNLCTSLGIHDSRALKFQSVGTQRAGNLNATSLPTKTRFGGQSEKRVVLGALSLTLPWAIPIVLGTRAAVNILTASPRGRMLSLTLYLLWNVRIGILTKERLIRTTSLQLLPRGRPTSKGTCRCRRLTADL